MENHSFTRKRHSFGGNMSSVDNDIFPLKQEFSLFNLEKCFLSNYFCENISYLGFI